MSSSAPGSALAAAALAAAPAPAASAPSWTAPPAQVFGEPDPPKELCCPIGRALMEDPVDLQGDHQTYERSNIEQHLRGHDLPRSPLTNLPLSTAADRRLVPNAAVQAQCAQWHQENTGRAGARKRCRALRAKLEELIRTSAGSSPTLAKAVGDLTEFVERSPHVVLRVSSAAQLREAHSTAAHATTQVDAKFANLVAQCEQKIFKLREKHAELLALASDSARAQEGFIEFMNFLKGKKAPAAQIKHNHSRLAALANVEAEAEAECESLEEVLDQLECPADSASASGKNKKKRKAPSASDASRASKRRKTRDLPAGQMLYETGLATFHGDKFLVADTDRGRYMIEAAYTLRHKVAEATCVLFGWMMGPPDDERAFELFSKCATGAGHASASYWLGQCYTTGAGVGKNLPKAVEHYTTAIEQGSTLALFGLAELYEDGGEGLAKNPTRAIELTVQAAEKGSAIAMWRLALHYARGERVAHSGSKAIELLTQSAAQENANAIWSLSRCYAEGLGVVHSPSTVVELLTKALAVDPGHVPAMNDLADMYVCGGVEIFDLPKAIELYTQVIEHCSCGAAMLKLALIYQNPPGEGVDKDVAKSIELCIRAGERGIGEALYTLGKIYEEGDDGVPVDQLQANKHYTHGAEILENPKCMYELALSLQTGTGIAQDKPRALELMTTAADAGVVEAQFVLGTSHAIGDCDQPVDYGLAAKYLMMAIHHGHVQSLMAMVELQQDGHLESVDAAADFNVGHGVLAALLG